MALSVLSGSLVLTDLTSASAITNYTLVHLSFTPSGIPTTPLAYIIQWSYNSGPFIDHVFLGTQSSATINVPSGTGNLIFRIRVYAPLLGAQLFSNTFTVTP